MWGGHIGGYGFAARSAVLEGERVAGLEERAGSGRRRGPVAAWTGAGASRPVRAGRDAARRAAGVCPRLPALGPAGSAHDPWSRMATGRVFRWRLPQCRPSISATRMNPSPPCPSPMTRRARPSTERITPASIPWDSETATTWDMVEAAEVMGLISPE